MLRKCLALCEEVKSRYCPGYCQLPAVPGVVVADGPNVVGFATGEIEPLEAGSEGQKNSRPTR